MMSREMRHSGIEWIGEIPKEWKTCRLKALSKIERGGSPRPIDDYISDTGYNWIKIGDTIKGNKYISTVRQKINESGLSKTRLVHKGDLILTNSMSYGEPYILNVDGCIHDGWVAISELKIIDKEFLYYSLSSSVCKIQFGLQVAGGVVNNLNVDKIGTTLIVLPPLSEQQKIANYLDKVCGEVDEMIALQEQMIEELKAYKQSVITEAVTKGLNPNAPMRDSGIDWIGEIPVGWRTTRIKSIITLLTDYDANGSFADIAENVKVNTGSPYAWMVRATDLENNRYGIVEGNNYCDENTYYYLSKSYLNGGEIIIAKRGEIGKVYLVPECGCKMTLAPNTYVLRLKDNLIFNKYLYYYMLSEKGKVQLVLNNKSTAIGAIYKEDVKKIAIALPTLSEQQSIASYLDTKCAEIDALIAIKQAKIEELKEYKKSVIYEHVTGKKEVV